MASRPATVFHHRRGSSRSRPRVAGEAAGQQLLSTCAPCTGARHRFHSVVMAPRSRPAGAAGPCVTDPRSARSTRGKAATSRHARGCGRRRRGGALGREAEHLDPAGRAGAGGPRRMPFCYFLFLSHQVSEPAVLYWEDLVVLISVIFGQKEEGAEKRV